ncbi:MAG TPA: lipase family protein [Bryobacteraceae bacterium]|nr:lipase family protein [Bryobacteraceae bacterium]
MPTTLDCRLLSACACAYDITAGTNTYVPSPGTELYRNTVAFTSALTTSCGGFEQINACLIGQNADGIIVAFRGTLPASVHTPESLMDWLDDFFAVPTSGEAGTGKVAGLVHSGFYDATMCVIAGVAAAIQVLNPAGQFPVYVTGHSKGGAMASLGAWILSQNLGIPVAKVVTFASPKTGDVAFQQAYQAKLNQIRYENYQDIVPLLPPSGVFVGWANKLDLIPGAPKDLLRLFQRGQEWGYEPVGQLQFIQSAALGHQVIGDEPIGKQIWDVVTELGDDIWHQKFDSFLDAHTLGCGFGYMSAACPGVCPP